MVDGMCAVAWLNVCFLVFLLPAIVHIGTRLIHDLLHKDTPGSYQRLDLFMKVLWVLCPNLTDDSIRAGHDLLHEVESPKS